MDGIYQNSKEITGSLQNWLTNISRSYNSWEGNNLHIDEINTLEKINRSEWIDASFFVFNILTTKFKPEQHLRVFMHIDLIELREKSALNHFSLDWLKNNINEFTPPSFHCTSLEYYENFYKQELNATKADNSLLIYGDFIKGLKIYYRTYFDESEELYSRELYFFTADTTTFPNDAQ